MHYPMPSLLQCHMLLVCAMVVLPAFAQEAKEPTKLQLKIEAAVQTNPDDTGRPSPVKVRVYELKDGNAFSEADYFSLNTNDKLVLGADLLAREEFILRPGESKRIERKSHPQTTVLGILAGYRDLNNVWRLVHVLPEAPSAEWYRMLMPSKKADLTVQLQPQGIVVVPAP